MIDERCGKPKSLEGASEGLIADSLFLAMMTISFLTLGRPQRLATYSKDDDDDNSSSTLSWADPNPTFSPRRAEADMPGVLQYHVES